MSGEALWRWLLASMVPLVIGGRLWVTRRQPFGASENADLRRLGAMLLALAADGVALVFTAEYLAAAGVFSFAYTWQYPIWLRAFGFVVLFAGVVLLLWAAIHLDRQASRASDRSGDTYPTTGPYQWIRHPVYTAILIQYVGAGLIGSSWVLTFVPAVLYLAALSRLVPQEERQIREALGQRQSSYIQRTGLFFPMTERLWEMEAQDWESNEEVNDDTNLS